MDRFYKRNDAGQKTNQRKILDEYELDDFSLDDEDSFTKIKIKEPSPKAEKPKPEKPKIVEKSKPEKPIVVEQSKPEKTKEEKPKVEKKQVKKVKQDNSDILSEKLLQSFDEEEGRPPSAGVEEEQKSGHKQTDWEEVVPMDVVIDHEK